MKTSCRLLVSLILSALLLSSFSLFTSAASIKSGGMTEYDMLYVGAKGTSTQNGGRLTALFTAFQPNDPSVDLYEGTWFNKLNGSDAVLTGGEREDGNPGGWAFLDNGGLGYEDPDYTFGNSYISLSKGYLDGDFEVETVAAIRLRDIPTPTESLSVSAPTRNADGSQIYYFRGTSSWNAYVTAELTLSLQEGCKLSYGSGKSEHPVLNKELTVSEITDGEATVSLSYSGSYLSVRVPRGVEITGIRMPVVTAQSEACAPTSFIFGSLYMMTWTSLSGSNTFKNGFGLTRYYVSNRTWGGTNAEWRDKNTMAALDGKIATLSVMREKGAYTVTHGDTVAFVSSADKVKEYPTDTAFRLFHNLPSDVYAIRIYSAPLTQAEKERNHLIDLLAYTEIPAEAYTALDNARQKLLASLTKEMALGEDKAETRKSLEDLMASLGQDTEKPLFYVTEGLTELYVAYEGLSSAYVKTGAGYTWFNLLDPEKSVSIYGDGWTRSEAGGFSVERTYEKWKDDHDFGLSFHYSQLPENDYTVEFTVNPYGIHDFDTDGNKIRYVDDTTKYGIFEEYGYVLGPLRGMSFASMRSVGHDGRLDKRWTYLSSGCWNTWCKQYNSSALFTDTSWEATDADTILCYAISLDENQNSRGTYRFYNNAHSIGSLTLPSEKIAYIDRRDVSEKRFSLLHHLPGTVYAVRIYNRTLREEELIQNKAADIIYYYNLDTTLLSLMLDLYEDDAVVYASLSSLDFDMTGEEAQYAADSALTSLLLSFAGNGIHQDYGTCDRIRYYFDVSEELLDKLYALGYHIELGAVASVGTGIAPSLAEHTAKVTAYEEEKNGFFVDENTFAVTVVYDHKGAPTRDYYLTDVYIRGYLLLTDETGKSYVSYVDSINEAGDRVNGLLPICQQLKGTQEEDGPITEYLNELIGLCSLKIEFTAGEGGYTLAEALSLAAEEMRKATSPTRVIVHLDEGEHQLRETIRLSGVGFATTYAELIIEGEGATISSLADLDSSDFTKYKENIYSYQFPKGENGKYPTFRYLYVDGKLATLAASGALRAASGAQSLVAFDRTEDGNIYLPASLVEPLRAEVTSAADPLTALKGKDVMMHIVCQWDYKTISYL